MMHKNLRLYIKVYGENGHLSYMDAVRRVADEYEMSVGGVKVAVHRAAQDGPEARIALMRYLADHAPTDNDSTRKIQAITDAGRAGIEKHRAFVASQTGPQFAIFRSDVHLPLQHDAAMLLYFKLLADIRPAWISALNDSLDNPKLSLWPDRRRLSEQSFDDDVTNLLHLQRVLLDTERDLAPHAAHVAVTGNHDARFAHAENLTTRDYLTASLMERLSENGVLFEHSIARQNVFKVCDGVYWTHGFSAASRDTTRATKNMEHAKIEAKITHDFNLITGHVHKPAITRTAYGMHYTNPCLCRLDPHYMRHLPAWSHGITVTRFDPVGKDAPLTTVVEFVHTDAEMVAHYAGKRYSVSLEGNN